MNLAEQAKTELEELIKLEQEHRQELAKMKKQIKSIKNFLISIGALERKRRGKNA